MCCYREYVTKGLRASVPNRVLGRNSGVQGSLTPLVVHDGIESYIIAFEL
jgi:hypothetical protein